MRNDFLQFVFYLIALVFGGALEEFLPKALGAGAPVLLALAFSVASGKSLTATVLFALAAGAFEDALSSLPLMTSPCVFLAVAVLTWRTRALLPVVLRPAILLVCYPVYLLWLMLIVPDVRFSLGGILLAMPVAALTAFVVDCGLAWLERKAAVDAP